MGTKTAPIIGHPTSGWGDTKQEKGQSDPAKAKADGYWEYSQSKGSMTHVLSNGTRRLIGYGYSGVGSALDDPAQQDKDNQGPIPRGSWIIGAQQDHELHNRRTITAAMPLIPAPGNDTGRTDFWIHGDTAAHNHTASQGCIVLPRDARDQIARSGDARLEVVHP